MALYSVDLMHRMLTGALNGPWNSGYTNYDEFRYRDNDAGHEYNLAYMDRQSSSRSHTGGQLYGLSRTTPRLYRSFDPSSEPALMDPMESQFEVRDDRLYVRFNGWFTVGELDDFWRAKSDMALYYTMYANAYHYTQIKVHVAMRRESEADLPENWRGARNPDIKIVYDHTKPSNTRVFGDMLFDITDSVCDCPRYRENVTAWKARFPVTLPKARNAVPDATVTTQSGQVGGSIGAATNGTITTGTTLDWNPNFDNDSEVKAQFEFPDARAVKQVRVYGWGADTGTYNRANYAPYHWRVEGSQDGSTWVKVPVLEAVRNAEVYNTDEVVTQAKSDYNPTVVNIDTTTAYKHYRVVFTDWYGEAGSGWDTVPLREIELYYAADIA